MSEPKRYALMGNPWEMVEHKNGNLVFYEDYARLKAEVEQWKFTLEEERQIMREDWAGLRCEKDRVQRALEYAEAQVERLTKAGDAMADSWLDGIRAVNWEAKDVKELRDWEAAKGVQS